MVRVSKPIPIDSGRCHFQVSGLAVVALLTLGFACIATAAPVPSAIAGGAGGRETLRSAYLRYSEEGSRDLIAIPTGRGNVEAELARLTEEVRLAVRDAGPGTQVVDAVRDVLLSKEGFSYDRLAGNPENYLLGPVLARRKGNCLGLTMLCLVIAERLGMPFHGVYVPSHCFVRYTGDEACTNVEFSDHGANWPDERYRSVFGLGEDRPYLRSLDSSQMLGVFLKSLGAAYSRRGRDKDALRLYGAAARLYPGLPDVHYNAGVALQKLGRKEEAVAMYRKALSLDPELAAPRENMSILLAQQGRFEEAIAQGRLAVVLEPWSAVSRGNLAYAYCAGGMYEEGIREYRKAAEIDPGSAPVRAGLARALFARGAYREAARECDRAQALGCRFEPTMLEVLGRYREPALPERASP
jgi:tetratricopeptide (TPR) repeat protein